MIGEAFAPRWLGTCAAVLFCCAAACSIWAAVDDPYKNDLAATSDAATAVAEAGMPDAGTPADAGIRPDAGTPLDGEGHDAIAGRRLLDAGFVPYAIAAYDDTVFAVDDEARVFVAHDASTKFSTFYAGDAGDTFLLQTNGIAAASSGVFWTVGSGIRYCGLDGSACGLLPSLLSPRHVAASAGVLAWIDDTGVRVCIAPPAGCVPSALEASRGAASVAVGPTGVVAWTDGGKSIELDADGGRISVDLPADISALATDAISGRLYWEGADAVGFLPFDGDGGPVSPLSQLNKPTQLFAARGVVYWSLATSSALSYCRFDSDAGCVPSSLVSSLQGMTSDDGIVATSRDVLTIVSSDTNLFAAPILVAWPIVQ